VPGTIRIAVTRLRSSSKKTRISSRASDAPRQKGVPNPDARGRSALVAGAFASTREIARMLGEQEFKTMFQQGAKLNLFILQLETHDFLTVVFDENSTLGIVKLKSQQLGADLSKEIQGMYQVKPSPLAGSGVEITPPAGA